MASMFDFEPVPYRIRIGVTGHRKLDDPAAVETMVKKAIDAEVKNLFSEASRRDIQRVERAGTTSVLYSVLSPLAEGADRVVARAVLDYPGGRLDVVLPLTVEDYLEDFETEESKKAFRELLARCRRPVRLRTRRIAEDRHDPGDRAELRREAYFQVGRYVVDHCDVLIAVWDGQPARGRGGTAQVVEYAKEQNRPIIRVCGSGFEVLNRDNNNGLDASALEGIHGFNRHAITFGDREAYRKNLDRDHFENPATARGIAPGVRELVNTHLFPYYVQASLRAKESQSRFYRAGKFIYWLSAAAVGCAALAALVRNETWARAGFTAELVLLIAITFTLWNARRKHSHQGWIENRFLAERIRSGVFMAICGVEPRPIDVLPYMGHSQTVNDWPVRVFDEIWDRLPPLAGCSQEQCAILNPYVREVWIGEQANFHAGKKEREGRARRRLAKAGDIVLPTTIGAAMLHLLLPAELLPAETMLWLRGGLTFIALLFPAIAASLAGMEAHREHLRLEERSANMQPQLEQVKKQMASAGDVARFQSLLQQVDEIMLRETQDWLMLMRFVEIKAG